MKARRGVKGGGGHAATRMQRDAARIAAENKAMQARIKSAKNKNKVMGGGGKPLHVSSAAINRARFQAQLKEADRSMKKRMVERGLPTSGTLPPEGIDEEQMLLAATAGGGGGGRGGRRKKRQAAKAEALRAELEVELGELRAHKLNLEGEVSRLVAKAGKLEAAARRNTRRLAEADRREQVRAERDERRQEAGTGGGSGGGGGGRSVASGVGRPYGGGAGGGKSDFAALFGNDDDDGGGGGTGGTGYGGGGQQVVDEEELGRKRGEWQAQQRAHDGLQKQRLEHEEGIQVWRRNHEEWTAELEDTRTRLARARRRQARRLGVGEPATGSSQEGKEGKDGGGFDGGDGGGGGWWLLMMDTGDGGGD